MKSWLKKIYRVTQPTVSKIVNCFLLQRKGRRERKRQINSRDDLFYCNRASENSRKQVCS